MRSPSEAIRTQPALLYLLLLLGTLCLAEGWEWVERYFVPVSRQPAPGQEGSRTDPTLRPPLRYQLSRVC